MFFCLQYFYYLPCTIVVVDPGDFFFFPPRVRTVIISKLISCNGLATAIRDRTTRRARRTEIRTALSFRRTAPAPGDFVLIYWCLSIFAFLVASILLWRRMYTQMTTWEQLRHNDNGHLRYKPWSTMGKRKPGSRGNVLGARLFRIARPLTLSGNSSVSVEQLGWVWNARAR